MIQHPDSGLITDLIIKGSVNSEEVPRALTEKFQVFFAIKSLQTWLQVFLSFFHLSVWMYKMMDGLTRLTTGKVEFLNRYML